MKHLTFIVVITVCSISASAQQVKLGIKGGLTLAKVNISLLGMSEATDNRVTGHGGFFATIMTSKNFGVQPELLYSGQGGTSSNGNLNLGYLNIPVMFRYSLAPWVNIQAGPQLSILLSATDGPDDISSQFKSMDFGGAIGLGVDLPFRFSLSFRYITGITNISTVDFSSLRIPDPDVSNRVIQISLGYNLSEN